MKSVTVTLSCGHEIAFTVASPRHGASLWCVRCQGMRRVTEVVGAWRWSCRNCSTGRRGDVVRWNSVKQATAHTNRFSHVTVVTQEGVPDCDEIVIRVQTEEIPF